MIDRGLDLLVSDTLTDAEAKAFRATYELSHGGLPAAYEFWLEFDPAVVKSHRLSALYTSNDKQRSIPLHGTLGFLYFYTVIGYEEGIRYEVAHSQGLGAPKQAVLQVMEIAFIQSGPRGIDRARSACADLLRNWVEPTEQMRFPDGWARDPSAYRIDYDVSRPEMDADELAATQRWYRERLGEIPGYVAYLLAHRPGLLKAFHNRLGRAMSGPLPAQIYPFLQLQLNVSRVDSQGMREAYLLGRGFGMSHDDLAEAIAWGTMYGGFSACSALVAAAQDVMDLPVTLHKP
jgi:hypothetical protein